MPPVATFFANCQLPTANYITESYFLKFGSAI